MTLPLTLLTENRELVTLHGAISIDNGPDDGRFLKAAVKTFKGASMHDSVTAAFERLAPEPEATLVGHGIDGFMGTGTGARLRHFERQHLCVDHDKEWGPILDALTDKRIKRLTLFGCSVGAGEGGAALVLALSTRLKATVRAPLGDVWIDEITRRPFMIRESGGWRVATNGTAAPQPLAAPAPLRSIDAIRRQPHASDLLMFDRDRFLALPFTAIQSLAWQPEDGGGEARAWLGDAARAAIGAVAFNTPLVVRGVPASFLTGQLWLTYRSLGQERERQFRVHNNRMLEDVHVPGVFYRVDITLMMGTAS
jgi:hypothetical protein